MPQKRLFRTFEPNAVANSGLWGSLDGFRHQIPECTSTPRRYKAAKTAENGQPKVKLALYATRGGGKRLALVLGQSGRLLV
eukprot:scaffold82809_cov33-Phaeocystis_antarctica.AAC.2